MPHPPIAWLIGHRAWYKQINYWAPYRPETAR